MNPRIDSTTIENPALDREGRGEPGFRFEGIHPDDHNGVTVCNGCDSTEQTITIRDGEEFVACICGNTEAA